MSMNIKAAAIGLMYLMVPMVPFAQATATPAPGQAAARLTDEQLTRLLDRMAGTWRLNVEKSVFFVGTPPPSPSGFIYGRAGNDSIRWTTADGSSIQILDGKAHPGNLPNQTVARFAIDEFT